MSNKSYHIPVISCVFMCKVELLVQQLVGFHLRHGSFTGKRYHGSPATSGSAMATLMRCKRLSASCGFFLSWASRPCMTRYKHIIINYRLHMILPRVSKNIQKQQLLSCIITDVSKAKMSYLRMKTTKIHGISWHCVCLVYVDVHGSAPLNFFWQDAGM